MIKREKKHRLDPAILDKHPEITSRMRSVLIDWLIEVSEVYYLHRFEFRELKFIPFNSNIALGKHYIWQ